MPACFHYSDEACFCNEEDACPSDYCAHCGERDILEALEPVYVATKGWHKTERLVHSECRDFFVKDNLPAVLASRRGVSL